MEVYSSDSDVSLSRAVFYLGAPWCGPCKKFLPLYKQFAEDYADDFEVKFYYINIDDFSTPSEVLENEVKRVSSIPTLLCFLDDKMVEKISSWNQDKLYTAMHMHYVPGEPVDNSRYAVIPDRVPYLPEEVDELSSSDGVELEFDIACCSPEDGCFEIATSSSIAPADDTKPEALADVTNKVEELNIIA